MPYRLGPRTQTAPLDLPAPPRDVDSGLGALGAGIAEGGDALQKLSTHYFEVEARGLATGGLATLQERLNKRIAEARSLYVAEKAVGLNETLPKEFAEFSAEIRAGLKNDKSVELYDAKAEELLAKARVNVYNHVLHEAEVVRVANADSRVKNAGDAIELDPDNADFYIADADDDVRSQAKGAEHADRTSAEWAREARQKQILGYLALGRLGDAKNAYIHHEKELGTAAPKMREAIFNFGLDQQSDAEAERIVDANRLENGSIAEAKADLALNDISDVRVREAVKKRLDERIVRERRVWDTQLITVQDLGYKHLNETGVNDEQVLAFLNAAIPGSDKAQDGPKLAAALVNRESILRRRKNATAADWARIQKDIDEGAWLEFMKIPEPRRGDVAQTDVRRTFLATGASENMLKKMEAEQTEITDRVNKGLGLTENDYRDLFWGKFGTRGVSDARRDAINARLNVKYRGLVREYQGKPPINAGESSVEQAARHFTKVRPGWKRDYDGSRIEYEITYPEEAAAETAPDAPMTPVKSKTQRMDELTDQGLSIDDIEKTMTAEGYQ